MDLSELDTDINNYNLQDILDIIDLDETSSYDQRIEAMASGIEVIAGLADPVGAERVVSERPNGLQIRKMRVPLGVVCMIFEARPNVTADAGALCFKSGPKLSNPPQGSLSMPPAAVKSSFGLSNQAPGSQIKPWPLK